MESFIVVLIIMALGALFNNKKKEEDGSASRGKGGKLQEMKDRNQGGYKRMEDYAKEVFGDFQSQMNPETDKKEQAKQVAQKVVERQTSRRPERETALTSARAQSKLTVQQKPIMQIRTTVPKESGNPFPLTQTEAQKAIVLAEVFMPPKSKRR